MYLIIMVSVAQLAEHRVVDPRVVGSKPTVHPRRYYHEKSPGSSHYSYLSASAGGNFEACLAGKNPERTPSKKAKAKIPRINSIPA